MSIYLDYNATTPIDERVLDTMIDVYRNYFGNADSRTHEFGDQARAIVENARKQVASLLSVSPDEVFFTSGATESNNIAIQGLDEYAQKTGKKHIITTSIEHKAVLETSRAMISKGYEVDFISPDKSGRIDFYNLKQLIRPDTLLVSVMHVNNETGIIQPIDEIGDYLNDSETLFHIDATQSCGKLVEELRKTKYDMLSFSAHKLRGPQGVGCLILKRKNYKLPPVKAITYGGQQEHGIRPGTIPVALVAGCGIACAVAEKEYIDNHKFAIEIRKEILSLLEHSGLSYSFNGDQNYCIANTLNISIDGVSSEALMISSKQYCGISNGSACTSQSYNQSYVLKAMGLSDDQIENSIRLSWGTGLKRESINKNVNDLINVAKALVI